MRHLIDTQAVIWFVDQDHLLTPTAHASITDPANDLLLSAASVWEIAIKVGLSKLTLSLPYSQWMAKAIFDLDLAMLPITVDYADMQAKLPRHHGDPFDRLIVAQAIVEGVGIISSDPYSFPWPALFTVALILLTCAIAKWVWISEKIWVLAGAIAFTGLLGLLRVRWGFQKGCINPGVVVATDPYLVAVLTDMRTSDAYPGAPTIKILRQPLHKMTGGLPDIGARLGTIATYQANAAEKAPKTWANFYPVVVNCATYDLDEIERVVASIDLADWKDLEEGLKQVPQPFAPGLYPIKLRRKGR